MWNDLTMQQRADVISMAVKAGMRDMRSIRSFYDETLGSRRFDDGGDTKDNTPGMTGMMKATLATAAHFGNPTARRMTNYDTRSYIWPDEYIEDGIFMEPEKGNVYVASYGNLVTPRIQDTGKGLSLVEDVWSPENERRSYSQSLKFNNEEDARYFGEHYKEIAPMMHLYAEGGHLFDGESEPVNALYKPEENVVHRVTRVNGDLVGMDPVTGRFYDNTTGSYIGDHVALEDIVITPQNGTIDDMGNVYQNIGGVTHMATPDGKHIILGEKPVSNVDPVGEFYVEGTALSPLFKPVERVVSGVLGAPEIVKSGKEILSNAFRRGSKKEIADLSRITARNAASITPEQWTAAQDVAIARGDMAEAQRLRDLHFKLNAPDADLPVQFHGTKELVGNKIIFGTPSRYSYTNYPFYTSSNEFYASLYGPKTYKFYVNEKDANLLKASNKENFMTVSKDRFNELVKRGNGTRDISRNDEITIFNPTKYKLANAVTYDDNGIRVPLGERDNFNINDIRYGLLPFGIGLAGLGLVNEE